MANDKKEYREMYEKKRLALHIRTIRESKGMSRSELADKSGYDPAKIAEMENGNLLPASDRMKDIANALDVSIEQLKGFGKIELTEKGYAKLTESEKTALFLLAPIIGELNDKEIRYLLDTGLLLCKAKGRSPKWRQTEYQMKRAGAEE